MKPTEDLLYPLVNVYITMENHHFLVGKIHYFDWAMFSSFLYVYQAGSSAVNSGSARGWIMTIQPPGAIPQGSNLLVFALQNSIFSSHLHVKTPKCSQFLCQLTQLTHDFSQTT